MKKINKINLIVMILVVSMMMLVGCSNKAETNIPEKQELNNQENNKQEEIKVEESKVEKTESDEVKEEKIEDKKVSEPINIATLNGPTGMGMVKLMEEDSEAFNITAYQSPDEIVGKVVSGEIDIACVPSNLAAVLYNKTQGGIKLLGTNTLGVLYLVEQGTSINSLADVKGKTILASGKGSTPEFILNTILLENGINPETDVTIEYMANHADVISALLADGENKVALIPEPHVTTAMIKGEGVRVAVDLNEEWKKAKNMDLPMGVIIASKDFVENKQDDLDIFVERYKKSVEFVNSHVDEAAVLVAKHQIVPSEAIAKQAIPKCNIIFRSSQESKESLDEFYKIISEIEPKSVGGKLPDEAFYINE